MTKADDQKQPRENPPAPALPAPARPAGGQAGRKKLTREDYLELHTLELEQANVRLIMGNLQVQFQTLAERLKDFDAKILALRVVLGKKYETDLGPNVRIGEDGTIFETLAPERR